MAELKTKKNDASVRGFIDGVENETRRNDAWKMVELMESVTGEKPAMWGPSIIGFGSYHYKYASGREGDWMLTGFSPRKQSTSVYLLCGFDELEDLLPKLGKYKTGKGCLYINKLADIDQDILKQMIQRSVNILREKY